MTGMSALTMLRGGTERLGRRWRRKRFALFEALIAPLPRPLRILDVGGTQQFWQDMGFLGARDIAIVLLNVSHDAPPRANFTTVIGDATDMREFADGEFDIVFSNAVLEHVGDFAQQQRMAREVRRVGKRYFVQTPNRYFPIEPHFFSIPYFQLLPFRVKVFLVRHFEIGWYPRLRDEHEAREAVRMVRLLSRRDLRRIFPGATLYGERLYGLTKSYTAYAGWDGR